MKAGASGHDADMTRLCLLSLAMGFALLAGCPSTTMLDGDAGPALDAAAGQDTGAVADAPSQGDTGLAIDAPSFLDAFRPPGDCTAMRVTEDSCGPLCDGPNQWYWDGERCVEMDCGACRGEDCGLGVLSEAACRSAHAACVPELCRATGGEWLFWAEECHHYRCGVPQPAECLIGMPVCDCGPGNVFVDGEGCVAEGTCPDPLPSPEALCTSTGGTWENVCCPSHCGVPCAAQCLAPACTCGPLQIFDEARGCVDAAECHDGRMVDQTCSLDGNVRCASGLLCCQTCGGAGCFGEPTCRAPVCDDTGRLDLCGNDRLAP